MVSLAAVANVASIATTILGAGLSIKGQKQEAAATKASAEYQAGILRSNQELAEREAVDAIDRGEINVRNQRMSVRQLIGRQRAVLAANGVLVDSGSALDIVSETAALGTEDILTLRMNAEREADSYRLQAKNAGEGAAYAISSGASASRAASTAAMGTLIGAAGTVADRWYRYANPQNPYRG